MRTTGSGFTCEAISMAVARNGECCMCWGASYSIYSHGYGYTSDADRFLFLRWSLCNRMLVQYDSMWWVPTEILSS